VCNTDRIALPIETLAKLELQRSINHHARRHVKTLRRLDKISVAQLNGARAMARYKPYDLNQARMIAVGRSPRASAET
jgi:hypothetical protein